MIKRFMLPLLAAFALSPVAHAALNEGDAAPSFEAQASLAGKAFHYSLADALKKGVVVVYFYPSAFTGGCNLQAHTFAVNQEKFAAAGATIVGVSLDSIARLNDFSADPQYCGGKIPVASDPGGTIARSYALSIRQGVAGKKDTRGVEIDHDFAERTTFIVTPDGKVSSVIGGIAADANVAVALEKAQQLAKR